MAGEWMFMHPMLRPIALVWGRFELPLWRSVLNRVAGWNYIEQGSRKRIRGKLHGYLMDLDLSDWSDRWAYFLGRYYEAHTQRLFQLALRPGDSFVDIGANIGMTTLAAAACVQPGGRILAFEPNPRVFRRLRGHVDLNDLQQVAELRNRGVSDASGELELHVPKHTGQASFANLGTTEAESHRVPVGLGDDELVAMPDAPMFIKIDVEGFECRVVAGLSNTLRQRGPAVMTEAVPSLLERAGSSIGNLFEMMHAAGYRGYSVDYTDSRWGWPGTLKLRLVDGPGSGLADDVLWLPHDGEHARRLQPIINR